MKFMFVIFTMLFLVQSHGYAAECHCQPPISMQNGTFQGGRYGQYDWGMVKIQLHIAPGGMDLVFDNDLYTYDCKHKIYKGNNNFIIKVIDNDTLYRVVDWRPNDGIVYRRWIRPTPTAPQKSFSFIREYWDDNSPVLEHMYQRASEVAYKDSLTVCDEAGYNNTDSIEIVRLPVRKSEGRLIPRVQANIHCSQ